MEMIKIELVYALASQQTLLCFEVPKGTTVSKAIELSDIKSQYPEIDLTKNTVGIFNKRVSAPDSHILQAGDRIEIYRPLLADPKEVRRRRAVQAAEKNKA